jgi:hypothetical protein
MLTVEEAPVVPTIKTEKFQRLVISKMVLINFKSYAGTIEIGPFHKVLFPFH